MPTDDLLEHQLASYFGWLEDQLDVPMTCPDVASAPPAARHHRLSVGLVTVGLVIVATSLAIRFTKPADHIVTSAESTVDSVATTPTDPATSFDASTTVAPVEPIAWAPVNLPDGLELVAVYRGLTTDALESTDVVPLMSFMILDIDDESMIYVSDEGALNPVVIAQQEDLPVVPIDGVGSLQGNTLTAEDGSVVRIGLPLIMPPVADETVLTIARSLAPVTTDELAALDRRGSEVLRSLFELGTVEIGSRVIVHRGSDPTRPAALCVRDGAEETCRPDTGHRQDPPDERLLVASLTVGDVWIVAGHSLAFDGAVSDRAICSATQDGQIIAALDVTSVTVADAEYFLSEVPANVNFTRLCVLDREPPTPNSTGITARPFSAG